MASNEQLAVLWDAVKNCTACDAIKEAQRPTPFSGNGSSGLFFILRNPGIQERDEGAPAVGKVKETMDDLLQTLDLNRQNVCITNLMNCYTCVPKNNRPPTIAEIGTCSAKHLQPLLDTLQPKLIVTFGKESFLWFCAVKGFKTIRGFSGQPQQWQKPISSDPPIWIFPMEHPAVHTLYDPNMKAVWDRDVRLLGRFWKALLNGQDPTKDMAPNFSGAGPAI